MRFSELVALSAIQPRDHIWVKANEQAFSSEILPPILSLLIEWRDPVINAIEREKEPTRRIPSIQRSSITDRTLGGT